MYFVQIFISNWAYWMGRNALTVMIEAMSQHAMMPPVLTKYSFSILRTVSVLQAIRRLS